MIWFIATGSDPEGPLDEIGLANAVAEGRLKPETLVWREGMEAWTAAKDVPEVAPLVAPPKGPAAESTDRLAARLEALAVAPEAAVRSADAVTAPFVAVLVGALGAGSALGVALLRYALPLLR